MKPRFSITLTINQTTALTRAYVQLEGKVPEEYFNVNGFPLQFPKAKFTPKQLKWIAHSLVNNGIALPEECAKLMTRLLEHTKTAKV